MVFQTQSLIAEGQDPPPSKRNAYPVPVILKGFLGGWTHIPLMAEPHPRGLKQDETPGTGDLEGRITDLGHAGRV